MSKRMGVVVLVAVMALTPGARAHHSIAAEFDMAWPSVSHHLTVLKNAGLVLSEREGQSIRYSLNTTVFQDVVQHLLEIVPPKRKKGDGRHA